MTKLIKSNPNMIISNQIMNGDVVTIKGIPHRVQIKGREGSYIKRDGKFYNIAIDNHGYLMDLNTGHLIRSEWTTLKVYQRAFPEFFPDEKII